VNWVSGSLDFRVTGSLGRWVTKCDPVPSLVLTGPDIVHIHTYKFTIVCIGLFYHCISCIGYCHLLCIRNKTILGFQTWVNFVRATNAADDNAASPRRPGARARVVTITSLCLSALSSSAAAAAAAAAIPRIDSRLGLVALAHSLAFHRPTTDPQS